MRIAYRKLLHEILQGVNKDSYEKFRTDLYKMMDSLDDGNLSGASAPTSTPTRIGQFYTETTTPALYYSKGTSGPSDWIALKNA